LISIMRYSNHENKSTVSSFAPVDILRSAQISVPEGFTPDDTTGISERRSNKISMIVEKLSDEHRQRPEYDPKRLKAYIDKLDRRELEAVYDVKVLGWSWHDVQQIFPSISPERLSDIEAELRTLGVQDAELAHHSDSLREDPEELDNLSEQFCTAERELILALLGQGLELEELRGLTVTLKGHTDFTIQDSSGKDVSLTTKSQKAFHHLWGVMVRDGLEDQWLGVKARLFPFGEMIDLHSKPDSVEVILPGLEHESGIKPPENSTTESTSAPDRNAPGRKKRRSTGVPKKLIGRRDPTRANPEDSASKALPIENSNQPAIVEPRRPDLNGSRTAISSPASSAREQKNQPAAMARASSQTRATTTDSTITEEQANKIWKGLEELRTQRRENPEPTTALAAQGCIESIDALNRALISTSDSNSKAFVGARFELEMLKMRLENPNNFTRQDEQAIELVRAMLSSSLTPSTSIAARIRPVETLSDRTERSLSSTRSR